MANLFHKFSIALQHLKTYQVGLLQAKAYRFLKQKTDEALADRGIASTEWAFLGMLYDEPEGMRAMDAADALGVEAPFVTRLLKKSQESGYTITKSGAEDSREKYLCLTPKGKTFVEETETYVRGAMRPVVAGVSRQDLLAYLTVLDAIVRNTEG